MVLMMHESFNAFKSTKEPLAFADAGYNGGNGGVSSDRRACRLSGTCDDSIWFGNVEKYCMKSQVALYGNRSPCMINREHVYYVLKIRSAKYKVFFE